MNSAFSTAPVNEPKSCFSHRPDALSSSLLTSLAALALTRLAQSEGWFLQQASSAGNGQRSNQQHLFRRRIFQSGARRHSAILSARAKSCLLAQAIEQFYPSPLNQYALLD